MKRTAAVIITALALLGIVASGLIAAGCGGSGGEGGDVPSDAVATVGDSPITKAQFDQLLTQTRTQFTAQGQTFPAEGSATYNSYVTLIVGYLVQAQIVAQSASDYGVSVTDKEVDDEVTEITESYGGPNKVEAMLKEQGMTMALLRQSISDRLLAQKVSAKVVAKATVSDEQIEAYWKANAAELSKKKKTATFAKAKATIRQGLLGQAQQKIWTAWLHERIDELGVVYSSGFSPKDLSPSPSPSASSGG